MPKPSTNPLLFDNTKSLNMGFLKKQGYLKSNQIQSGNVFWKCNGHQTGSISIQVNTSLGNPYLQLDYKHGESLIKYRVNLIGKVSNLGLGIVWYFVCPNTGKHCRKLYLSSGYFYHRSACKDGMYERQTLSKNHRAIERTMNLYFRSDNLYEQIYKKHFKKQYAGKPTKRYLKLTQQIEKSDSQSQPNILKMLNGC